MTEIVRTDGLVKRYDGTLAVAGVDLSVNTGEIFGLVGPNGAGKTTTLRMLATLLAPSAGPPRSRHVRHAEPRQGAASSAHADFSASTTTECWESRFRRALHASLRPRGDGDRDLLALVDLARSTTTSQTLPRGIITTCLLMPWSHPPVLLLARRPQGSPHAPSSSCANCCAAASMADHPPSAATASRARGTVYERRDRGPRPGARPVSLRRHREASAIRGRLRVPAARGDALERPGPLCDDRMSVRVLLEDGTI